MYMSNQSIITASQPATTPTARMIDERAGHADHEVADQAGLILSKPRDFAKSVRNSKRLI